jgi:hypothetical protein
MPALVSQGQEAGKAAEEAKKAEEEAARKATEEAAAGEEEKSGFWGRALNVAVGVAKVALSVAAVAAGAALIVGTGGLAAVAIGAVCVAGGVFGVYDGYANNIDPGFQGKSYEFDPWDLAYLIPLAGRPLSSGAKALRAAVPLVDDAARAIGAGAKAIVRCS